MSRCWAVRMRSAAVVTAAACLVGPVAVGGGSAAASNAEPGAPGTTRVSVSSDGGQAKRLSFDPDISANGRYVVFYSDASNLVAGDTNGKADVFVRDRKTDVTRRVSVGAGGVQAHGASYGQAISADGRYVAFTSYASNLVDGDTNRKGDVFVRDLVRHVTRRVSVGAGGVQADGYSVTPAISADGRYVAFTSAASNLVVNDSDFIPDVFVRDRVAKITERVSVGPGDVQADGDSGDPAISQDGRYVAFSSTASNLGMVADANGRMDVFLRNRVTHLTRRVSVGSGGAEGNSYSWDPAISARGGYVAFRSRASNLVDGDTNGRSDVFVRDRAAHLTRRVSVGPGGAEANGFSREPAISAHGRYVAFTSKASNLVATDTNTKSDVFIRDRVSHVTRRVSVGSTRRQANGASGNPAISAHSRHVAFNSRASNLVAGDTNNTLDVFIRNLGRR